MFHWALVKSIMAKIHSQMIMTKRETMMMYKVYVKKKAVDVKWIVMKNIDHTIKVLTKKTFNTDKRMSKEGLPYVCNLTHILPHFSMSFEGYDKVAVKES